MKAFKYLLVIALIFSNMLLTSCGGGSKKLEGSYTRYSGDDPIIEHWEINLNADGSCDAVNTAEGCVNYTHSYHGTWQQWSDDIVKVDMTSEPVTAHVTRSYDETRHEANKAQTKWKRNQVYAEANEHPSRTTTRQYNQEFYIRDDGATATYPDGLNNPQMILH